MQAVVRDDGRARSFVRAARLGLARSLTAAAFSASLVIPSGALAEPLALSPAQMLDAANRLVLVQRPAAALTLARALIARDPEDFSAQLTASYAARDLGDFKAAEHYGKQAWETAQTADQRYNAALAVAQALASSEQRSAAQIWLRRAVQAAPDARARNRAIRDYRYVRARNPWSYNLNIAIAPSDNLNAGTSTHVWDLGPILLPVPAEMQALSGVSTTVSASVALTIREDANRRDRIGLQATRREVKLSSEARKAAPHLRNSDFSYQQIEGFYEHAQRFSFGEITSLASLGQSRYGGTKLADFGRLSLDWERPIGDAERGGVFGATLGLEREFRRDNATRSADTQRLGLRWGERLGEGHLLASLDWKRIRSDSAAVDRGDLSARVQYALAKPILGAHVALWAGLGQTDYGYSPYTGGARRDLGREFGVSAFLANREFFGFAPEIAVTWDENRSDAVLFERSETAVSLRLRSTF